MKCILHVGSAKTGTSSLQEILFNSPRFLASKGCLYPASCLWQGDRSHNTLGIYFWNNFLDKFKVVSFEEILARLLLEIKGWPEVIISSELIEKAVLYGNENLTRFLQALAQAGYEINVVYVVRRQDFYIDSQFKQAVGDPLTLYSGTVDEYIKSESLGLMYGRVAASWLAQPEVSSVTVIPYVEGRIDETFRDVLASMGYGGVLEPGMSIPKTNLSLDGDYLRLKHFLNSFLLPSDVHHQYLTTLRASHGYAARRMTLFTPQLRESFLLHFAADQTQLEANFGVDLSAWRDEHNRAGDLFTPLTLKEFVPAMELLKQVNVALHDEILAEIKGQLD